MIQIVIPAAGNGQRFKDAGYKEDKPDIDVFGKRMIDRVIEDITPSYDHTIQVIRQKDLKKPSGGAVETILHANIDPDEPLLLANSDQLVDIDIDDFIDKSKQASLVTFQSTKPHHSYVKTNNRGLVTEIIEKEVISNQAVTGVYFFRKASYFTDSAVQVIASDTKVKGEYYVSTVLERMIKKGYRINTYTAPSAMLGTPDELQLFINAAIVGRKI